MKRLTACATLLVALIGIPYSPFAHAQASCSSTYDSTKKYCTAVVVGPWTWHWKIGAGRVHGPFPSQGEALADLKSFTLGPTGSGQDYCDMTLKRIEDDGPPVVAHGIDREYHYDAHYDVVIFKSDQVPCQRNTTRMAHLRRERQIGCPTSSFNGQSWALITSGDYPRCEIPWTGVFDRGDSPQLCKGNPCDVVNGSKLQFERDYIGSGPFPLSFSRTYESRLAFKTYFGGASEEFLNPLGIGWSANYFQTILYSQGLSNSGASVRRPNGRRLYFNETAGVMTPQAGVAEQLIRLADGGGLHTGWKLILPDDTTETYDAIGRLISIRARTGLTQTVSYAGDAIYPQSVSDSFGNTLAFTYTVGESTKLESITLPDGEEIVFGYSSISNLVSVTYPDEVVREYHYELTSDRRNLLTGITDESGVRYASWTYASSGNGAPPTSSKHAGDVDMYTFSYPSAGTHVVTDPLGQSRTYTSTSRKGQRLLTGSTVLTPGSSERKAATYDNFGNVSAALDFSNNETRYEYDTQRQLETSRTEAFGTPRQRTVITQWHPTFRLPAQAEDALTRTTFSYDPSGVLLSKTVLDLASLQSRTWSYTSDSYGRVLTEDGPRTDVSDISTYSYYTCATGYECGHVHTITNPLGHVTSYDSYNAHGQPTQITDPNGLVTTLAYDLRLRLTDRCVGGVLPACSGGQKTHLDYWPTGLLKKVTNPDGSHIEYIYDAAHRLVEIKDGALNRSVYTLDNAGNRTAENVYDPGNALRRTHSRIYNSLGQLWKDVNAAGTAAVTTSFGYDNNGNQTSVAAPLGRNSSSLYDELNRLVQITDPASGVTQFGYDANDNLTSVTDPRNLVTSYTYNGLGDLLTQVSPDTGATTNTYDSGGNLDTSTDARGVVTDYDYDAANRVTSASFTLNGVTDQTITYGYDGGTNQKGHLTSASDANHSLAWIYDAHGRVTNKSQTLGSVTLTQSYGYNDYGQLVSTTLPSGAVIGFGYDANGQVTSVTLNGSTTILSNVTYDPFGPITGWTWGNGTTASRAFDTDGKITQVDNADGASLKDHAYDDAFRITGITDAADGTLSWSYGYDSLDRLTSAQKSGFSQGWTYDANGNRLTESGSAPSNYAVSSTSNRIDSISGSLPRTYGYDAAGNTLSYAGATFTYNNRGRMVTASNAGTTANYVYNALGQRARRSVGGSVMLYAYDEAGHLTGEYSGAGALVQETVWLGDTPVATLRPNGSGGVELFYVHADHLNSPRLVTDISNNVRWSWESDPFGTTVPNVNPSGLGVFLYDLRFPGQQYDAAVGLHYNYFRDYDPSVGRYIESDPLGLEAGVNTYGYSMQDPLRFIDPHGLRSLGAFVECLAARANGDYMRNCNMVLFATATASAIRDVTASCNAIGEGLVCAATCTAKQIIGQDLWDVAKNAHKEAASRVLQRIAKEAAEEGLRRAAGSVLIIDKVYDVVGATTCTVECVKH